ncbi:MAG: c-type cytochrome [Lentisphaeraceae bacterium]|nr:c-type cytochrome [Lentisphaeraceae bacterium]
MKQILSKQEMNVIIKNVLARGNAHLGEKIYRKQSIACISCHAIGGAGAEIGPDLISIGASAPIDYIIESLLQPTKKIKEGYHMTMVTTKDGRMIAGSEVSATKEQVIIRDALGKLQKIPTPNIKSKKINSMSMMPPGLTASLNKEEFIHLVSFLSQLGKEGDFKLPQARYVRTFELLKNIPRKYWAKIHTEKYQKVYTKVSGTLPLKNSDKHRSMALKFDLKVLQAGTLYIKLSSSDHISLMSDKRSRFKIDKKLNIASLEVKKGDLSIITMIAEKMTASDFSLQIIEGKSNALVKIK